MKKFNLKPLKTAAVRYRICPEVPLFMENSAANGKIGKICKYFASSGYCFYGDSCQFVHSKGKVESPLSGKISCQDIIIVCQKRRMNTLSKLLPGRNQIGNWPKCTQEFACFDPHLNQVCPY